MNRSETFWARVVLMLMALVVLLLPLSCENSDYSEKGDWDDLSIIKTKSGCDGKCSPSCQCNWTEVGCETDNDCSSGLYCKIRSQLGNRCLISKAGDDQSNSDGDCAGKCSSSCQCGRLELGCKTDSDCMSGLYCEQRPQLGNRCLKKKAGDDQSNNDGGQNDNNDNDSNTSNNNNSKGELKIVVFSVGSADASLIVFPTGKKMMIDSATDTKFKKVVYPFLQRHKVNHLDYYLETHPHGDHIGGRALLKSSGYVDSKTKQWDWNTYDYEDQFNLEGTKWFISNARDTSFHGNDANYNSVSYRIEYNGFVYSGAGDEGTKAQNRYLKDHPNLVKAHVRNTAHHMWGPVSQSYLVATNPFLFIISSSSDVKQDSAFRNTFLGAVNTLKKSGRLREYGLTADVGHIIVRASSGSNWDYDFCSNVNTCTVPGLL